MVVTCYLLVEMSVRGGMLTIAGSSWGEKDITPVEKKKKIMFYYGSSHPKIKCIHKYDNLTEISNEE
jgi:hypothetical protein